jgi:uncharacterized repeat protein (TIGR01451 family)
MNRITSTIFAMAFIASPIFAQSVEITNQALLEVVTVDENGEAKVSYEEATIVLPGSAILYRMEYTNVGDTPAEGVVLKSPIPPSVVYTEGSAELDEHRIQYSIDSGVTFANREDLFITNPDGTIRPALATDLTNIQWTVFGSLDLEASATVSFRAIVK